MARGAALLLLVVFAAHSVVSGVLDPSSCAVLLQQA